MAVGQGHSPARTLRRESRGAGSKPRRKKFDTARLSFGGLEQVCVLRAYFLGVSRGDRAQWRTGYRCLTLCMCVAFRSSMVAIMCRAG